MHEHETPKFQVDGAEASYETTHFSFRHANYYYNRVVGVET